MTCTSRLDLDLSSDSQLLPDPDPGPSLSPSLPFSRRELLRLMAGTSLIAAAGLPLATLNAAEGTPAPLSPRETALRWWAWRDDPARASNIWTAFEAWAKAAPNDLEAMKMLARGAYWLAVVLDTRWTDDQKRAVLNRGVEIGRQVATQDPGDPAGDFWAACCLASYGRLVGPMKSVSSYGEIRERLGRVEKKEPGFCHGGVWRFYGQLIDQVPGVLRASFGYSLDDAVAYYEKALKTEPRYLHSHLFMADLKMLMERPTEAWDMLVAIHRADHGALPGTVPENKVFKRLGRAKAQKYFPGRTLS